MKSTLYKRTIDSYHQFWLPEYNGVAKEIYCKRSHHTLARISSEGHLEVFKGYSYNNLLGGKDASLIRDVISQIYNSRHGKDFYTRKDINIIYCNMMKTTKVNYFVRKGCYFWSVCYSIWEKFNRNY